MRCYACQQPNNPTARFCIECGASLAPTAWAQPAPAEVAYAPLPYAPPPPASNMVAVSATPGTYLPDAPPGSVYAPYGYVPAPAPGPAPYGYIPAPAPAPAPGSSLVNNVTVQQVTPPAAAPAPQPKARGKRRASDLTVLLSALFFLASGLAIGVMWTSVHAYDGGTEVMAACAITVIALLINIMILARITRR